MADSSLDYDREVKLPLYAEANISDYWLLNLGNRYLEAYSEPCQISGQYGYLNRRIVPINGVVALPTFIEPGLELSSVFPDL